jgi:hypothetical protein
MTGDRLGAGGNMADEIENGGGDDVLTALAAMNGDDLAGGRGVIGCRHGAFRRGVNERHTAPSLTLA